MVNILKLFKIKFIILFENNIKLFWYIYITITQ